MTELSPSQRSLHARMAAHTRWSKQDPVQGTAAARAAFQDRFTREVDPDGVLPETERMRRAESARKAYYTNLALKSSRARQARTADAGGRNAD